MSADLSKRGEPDLTESGSGSHFLGTRPFEERRCVACGAFLNRFQYDLCSKCEEQERRNNEWMEMEY